MAVLFIALLHAGCVSQPPIGFLAVGDTGYSYAFLDEEDYAAPKTLAEFEAAERAKWIEDGRGAEPFVLWPAHRVAQTGGYVAASGLQPVATAMRKFCVSAGCDFGVMLGDNIYPDGATANADGRDDERFRLVFTEPYGPLAAGRPDFRFYAALGNHDWKTSRAGALAQAEWLGANRPFYMDGFFYRVKPAAARGEVELFVIDTELLLATRQIPETSMREDGTEVVQTEHEDVQPWLSEQSDAERGMAEWLAAALASSDAKWKIVVGHHPLWSTSGGKVAQARALRALILPALCRHADMYLAGHEHTLEVHTDDCSVALPDTRVEPLLQVVSGAGAKQRPSHAALTGRQPRENPELKTLYARGMVWGFAHVTLAGDRLTVEILSTPDDGGGRVQEEFTYTVPRRSGAAPPGATQ
jgi:hypothetical protein